MLCPTCARPDSPSEIESLENSIQSFHPTKLPAERYIQISARGVAR